MIIGEWVALPGNIIKLPYITTFGIEFLMKKSAPLSFFLFYWLEVFVSFSDIGYTKSDSGENVYRKS